MTFAIFNSFGNTPESMQELNRQQSTLENFSLSGFNNKGEISFAL